MKLKDWAKKHGFSYMGAWKMFRNGKLPNAEQLPSGAIIINEEKTSVKPEYTVLYCRVSSSQNSKNLGTQADRLTQFAIANGWEIHSVVKETASGLNDSRPKLNKILSDATATRLIVEHKDRLTRFGFNYLQQWAKLANCEIIVVNHVHEDKEDLVQDFISIITSYCARIYGLRRSKRETEKIVEALSNDS